MPRVLFVSYAFPPVGGVGVQRILKWTKFLPEFGWDCSVLTTANPSVPILDESLLSQIPPATRVARARTLEPGYAAKQAATSDAAPGLAARVKSLVKKPAIAAARKLLQPDPQILWNRDAARVGRQLLADQPHDVILATAPPFSSLLLGRSLAKSSGLPLVVDYRDEWDLSNRHWENKRPGRVAMAVQRRMQNASLDAASVILSTTDGTAAELKRRAAEAGIDRPSVAITNGYDPDDFPPLPQAPREDFGNGTDRYRLTFAGTLWALNTIEPFARGLETLPPETAAKLELVCVGRRLDDEEQHLDRIARTGAAVTRLGFVPHARAVELMRRSDGLLQQTAGGEGTGRVISAKTFEYIAAGRPVLLIAEEGDQSAVVRKAAHSETCEPGDAAAIGEAITRMIERGRVASADPPPEYHRREVASQLADLLSGVIKTGR